MNKTIISISAFVCTCLGLWAQTKGPKQAAQPGNVLASPAFEKAKEVVMTVGGTPVYADEFESIFKKNNRDAVVDRQAIDDYLDMFINFKLKVKEAEANGLDTVRNFVDELQGYRKQLAQPYLMDKQVNDQLIQEAFERSRTEVRASHILIRINNEASPKDTLAAYNKAMEARAKVLAGGDFANLARQYSEDPSAAQNGGDLGYFSVLMMVYPFENAAYNTPVGQVSMPVRTKFGYHIVKVADKRPARGQVRVAHILVRVPSEKDSVAVVKTKDANGQEITSSKTLKVPVRENDSLSLAAKKKIQEIMMKYRAGEKFEDLAQKFSDDRTSGRAGGQLAWFGTGKMVPDFENAAFSLEQVGDVTEPFRTQFGYHIIKLLDKKGLQTFDEMKGELKIKVQKDSRSQLSREVVIERVKKQDGFKEDPRALAELIARIDTSYYSGKWKLEAAAKLSKPLFTIGNRTFTQADFAQYIFDNQGKTNKDQSIDAMIRKAYKVYAEDRISDFEEERLEQKYDDFRLLMQEYRDGILLFEITDRNVWSKALEDTSGLRAFYEGIKSDNMWGERANVHIFKAKDPKTAKAVRKLIAKQTKKGGTVNHDIILKEINKESSLNVQFETGLFSKGDNEIVDKVFWSKGLVANDIVADQLHHVLYINEVLPPEPKKLSEIKGLVTAAYQNHLEKEWIASLRAKYPVQINRDALYKIR